MSDLFILDLMIGYVLPVTDELLLIPVINFKLLDFPSLTVNYMSPSEQEELKKKFQGYLPSDIANEINLQDSQNRITFKRGKSCSFRLNEQETQKLCLPLTITLKDTWYLPAKELARTCVDILVPHFKQGSAIVPVKGKKVYEMCRNGGSKMAMIELSYKLKRVLSKDADIGGSSQVLPACEKKSASRKLKEVTRKAQIEDTFCPQKCVTLTDSLPWPVTKSTDKLTTCPPPLVYNASSEIEGMKLQSEVEAAPYQHASEIVWPNGYVYSEPGWIAPKEEEDLNTVLLPSSTQGTVPQVTQDKVNTSRDQNFQILRALTKELSTIEKVLESIQSRNISQTSQQYREVCVQTDSFSTSNIDQQAPTIVTGKKLVKTKNTFTRECCTKAGKSICVDNLSSKQSAKAKPTKTTTGKDTSPRNKTVTSPRNKAVTSPRNKAVTSPPSKSNSSVLYKNRIRKVIINSPNKQKTPKSQVDLPVCHVSQITDRHLESDEKTSQEFTVNTSVDQSGDHSKLNIDIHLPTVTKIPSVTAMSITHDQDNDIRNTVNDIAATLAVPAISITPSMTPMGSAIPSAPASQPERLTVAMSDDIDVQSYSNLSLSEFSEDPLNQSRISTLMFSTKHLEAALADEKSAMPTVPTGGHDGSCDTDAVSPYAGSNESVQYKDDFESSDCSSNETSFITS